MQQILDTSVVSGKAENTQDLAIKEGKVIDLTKLNVSDVRKIIKEAPYKAIEVENLKEYIEQALEEMVNKNQSRIKFSERYKGIIDRYNSGGTDAEDYYNQLIDLIEQLKEEQERPNLIGLSEEELEIYDLLIKGKKLTTGEEQKVKLASKNLYKKLIENKEELLVVDWYKDEVTTSRVRTAISDSLDADLPMSYDKDVFVSKTNLVLSLLVDKATQGLMAF